MKTAIINRTQLINDSLYKTGDEVKIVRSNKRFSVVRTPEGDKQIYTADLTSFKTIPTKASIKKEQVKKALNVCENTIGRGVMPRLAFLKLRQDLEAIGQGEILYK